MEKADNSIGNGNINSEDEDIIEVTSQSAMIFILIASCTLLVFYFFDMHIVILTIYVMGATLSIALVFLYPRIKGNNHNEKYAPEKSYINVKNDHLDWALVTSLLLATVITSIWLFYRHSAWSWVLQDFMVFVSL